MVAPPRIAFPGATRYAAGLMTEPLGPDAAKQRAAAAALTHVEPGMRLGLGTGSTAAHFVAALGVKVAQGFDIVGVPTSKATEAQAAALGIPLTTLDGCPELDLVVDGADEVDDELRLIKGGGGALLREKIVAASANRMIVIVDASKRVAQLGRFPLPIEIVRFGFGSTRLRLERELAAIGLTGGLEPRMREGAMYVTDEGHYILDGAFGALPDPERIAARIAETPGVVEHGLFLGLATMALIARASEVELLRR